MGGGQRRCSPSSSRRVEQLITAPATLLLLLPCEAYRCCCCCFTKEWPVAAVFNGATVLSVEVQAAAGWSSGGSGGELRRRKSLVHWQGHVTLGGEPRYYLGCPTVSPK